MLLIKFQFGKIYLSLLQVAQNKSAQPVLCIMIKANYDVGS